MGFFPEDNCDTLIGEVSEQLAFNCISRADLRGAMLERPRVVIEAAALVSVFAELI